MTIIGKEKWDIGPITFTRSGGTATIEYFLHSDDPANDTREDALNWLIANAPADVTGYLIDGFAVNKLITDIPEDQAIWDGVVNYASRDLQPAAGDPDGLQAVRISVRSGGGESKTMTFSRNMVAELAPEGSWVFAGDSQVKRMLNLSSEDKKGKATDLTAEGINISVGTVEIVVETIVSHTVAMTNGFIVEASSYAANNVINSVAWRGFPINSLRLTNFDSKQRQDGNLATDDNTDYWDLTYTFSYEPTLAAASIIMPSGMDGGTFPVDKLGHQYLDTTFLPVSRAVVGAAGMTVTLPLAKRMALHDIYPAINFEFLRI